MSIAAKITTTSAKQTFNLGKKLAAKLREQKIQCARRTVAKYRQQLRIRPAHQRRQKY